MKVLIPTDFSLCAGNAINMAIALSKVLPVEITLLHVIPDTDSRYSDYVGLNRELRISMEHESLEKLKQVQTSITETETLPVKILQCRGTIKSGIIDTANGMKADMIIMGTLGSGGTKERLWGSNAAAVIGKTNIPVLAVPIEFDGFTPSEILFATEHFETAPEILNPLCELAAICLAKLHIVVFSPEKKYNASLVMDHSRKLEQYKTFFKDRYHENKLVTAHLSGNNFDEAIEKYITEHDIDMLVMVTYKLNFIERFFHPSKTKKMAYLTRVPLLAIPTEKSFLDFPYRLLTIASG